VSKAKPDYDAVKSELSESLFFKRPEEAGEQSRTNGPSLAEATAELNTSPERVNARTGERVNERSITRMSFEIYRDQHAALKQFSIEEMSRGEKGSMSEMVRDALDAYINKRRRSAR
jgi:hypothetical protein